MIAAFASRMVSPSRQVSSTMSTRRPITSGGAAESTAGISRTPSDRYRRLTMIEWNGRSSIAATTAPGTTPAVATPMTTSGSNSFDTLSARARESSPKRGQSTSMVSRTGIGGLLRGVMAVTSGGLGYDRNLGRAPRGWNAVAGAPAHL